MSDLQTHIDLSFMIFIKFETTHKVVRTKGLSNAHMNNKV